MKTKVVTDAVSDMTLFLWYPGLLLHKLDSFQFCNEMFRLIFADQLLE